MKQESKMKISKEPFLSICITSYNRVNELKRCLESIDSEHTELVEVVVSEDCSPRKHEIHEVVEQFKAKSAYSVLYNSNEKNLGYDCNLGKLIQLAKGKYIIFISDDDCFIEHGLDKTIEFIQNHDCNVAFGSIYQNREKKVGRKYAKNMKISKGIDSVKRYIYDSILFSGLIFKRELVTECYYEKFRNLNYFQIYLFMSVLYKYDGYYMDIPTICTMSDGENAFGISESSEKNNFLADRESLYSMLEFHKGLIKIIQIFDEDNMTDVLRAFEKEYSLRTYHGLSTAHKAGKKEFKIYWNRLNALDIHLSLVAKIYYLSLCILGSTFCDALYKAPEKCLILIRQFCVIKE